LPVPTWLYGLMLGEFFLEPLFSITTTSYPMTQEFVMAWKMHFL
jgi:hypothetical protein